MNGGIPLIERAERFSSRTAVIDSRGEYSYGRLLDAARRVAAALQDGREDLREARVAFLIPPSFEYVAVQWGIWMAGGIAVPLCLSHPPPELAYVLKDTDASQVVADPGLHQRIREIADGRAVYAPDRLLASEPAGPPEVEPHRRAQILYTSGTTGRPKGVVTTHRNLEAQIISLVDAWAWNPVDRTLLVLPLHHTHGIVNVLGCALWSGAVCEMPGGFDPDAVWQRFESGELTLFMAVPTIYVKLIRCWEGQPPERQAAWSTGCRKLRLMVSGSAALPVPVLRKWEEITGHRLLERYGMTEIGMALSNPLKGERRPGSVGIPLPGVEVRLTDANGSRLEKEGEPGEIEVRGPGVFQEYWRRPEATKESFRPDDWFRTGDVAVVEHGYYRILGRSSVDIIKTGGYKVSALEIEEALRAHPAIEECAVVGVPDEEWGERVGCAAVLKPDQSLSLEQLREWGRRRLAVYKIPSRLETVPALPRNALGKVTKPAVKKLF